MVNSKWDVGYKVYKLSLFNNDNVGLVNYLDSGIEMKNIIFCTGDDGVLIIMSE